MVGIAAPTTVLSSAASSIPVITPAVTKRRRRGDIGNMAPCILHDTDITGTLCFARVSDHLFNRELSWLEFNRRVLAEADDATVPLLERVKFLGITANNLDEFLMVRMGAIRSLIVGGARERSPDGMTPKQQLKAIRDRVKSLLRDMYRVHDTLLPQLRKAGVRVDVAGALTKKQQAALA